MSTNPQGALHQSGEQMSVKAYFQLDTTASDIRYEYHGGTLRLMSGGTKAHDDIAFNIRAAPHRRNLSGH